MTLDAFEEHVRGVAGIGTGRHCRILYGLVRWLQPRAIVEVGSWRGFTGAWLARGLQDNGSGMLYCIDDFSLPGGSLDLFVGAMKACGVQDWVQVANGKSEEVAWPDHVDMAFIDGDHSLAGASGDIERAMRAGASCIVLHDTCDWWGPHDWLEHFRGLRNPEWDVLEVNFDGGLAILLRRQEKPPVVHPEHRHPSGKL